MSANLDEKKTAILVDDEVSVRSLLRESLAAFDYLEIVGEAGNVSEAVKLIHRYKPSLVFLDIEMPGYTGLKLLDFFNEDEITFDIIFVTAFNEYAINAFKLAAFDYLLKPVDEEQLQETLDRYLKKDAKYQTAQRIGILKSKYNNQENDSRIAIPSTYGVEFLDINEIVLLEAENNYTKLILKDKKTLVASKTLSDFESTLSASGGFFRTHRSYLINISEISKLNLKDGVFIELKSGHSVPLSRYRRKEFEELYHKFRI